MPPAAFAGCPILATLTSTTVALEEKRLTIRKTEKLSSRLRLRN